MVVGVPREIKDNEGRVALVPAGVRALVDAGHRVLVESGAGALSSIPDGDYAAAGAEVVAGPAEVYSRAGLVVKVKEPRPGEYAFLREGLIVFTFFHLASDPALAEELIKKGAVAVAYETTELDNGALPILAPMSEVAGRLSVLAGAHHLTSPLGGSGVLLPGVPGVSPGRVAIIGAGVVGLNAAKMAVGLGARVTVIDSRAERLRYFDDLFGSKVTTLFSNSYNIARAASGSDLLIGAVHIPGARTPRLVTRDMVRSMMKGSVIVDVSVDQGGCIEGMRPTTHSEPAFVEDGVIHYGVANMPGAVPRTSTFALTNATLPYVLKLANMGLKEAAKADRSIAKGINILEGRVLHKNVADALGKSPPEDAQRPMGAP